MIGRRKPYTAIGIRRLRCVRCNAPAHATWQICSDGNLHRPICLACDVALNALVLKWMGVPDAAEKLATYRGATTGRKPL